MSWKDLAFDVTKGATLVDGWNEDDQRSEGSGKSAILNSISWAIYGKLPKDANVDEVIKDGESHCSVALIFSNGESIVRSRKPNDLYILKPTGQIKGKDARETQSLIEEYIGCNFETFCQSVYFAQNYDKKFLSSNQEDKGKILSSIQNLQIFDKARKEAMDLLKLENDKNTTLRNQVQIEESNLKNFQTQLSMVQSFIQDKVQKHQSQVSMLTQQKDLLSGHVKRTQSDINNIESQLSQINLESLTKDEQELNQAKTDYSTNLNRVIYEKGQVESIKKVISSKESEGRVLATKYNNLQNKKQLATTVDQHPGYLRLLAERKKSSEFDKSPRYLQALKKKSDLEAYIQNPSKTCPSCGSELKNIDLSKTQAELNAVNLELSEAARYSAEEFESSNIQIQDFEVQFQKDLQDVDSEMALVLTQLQGITEYLDQNKVPSVDKLLAEESEIRSVMKKIEEALFNTQQGKLNVSRLESQKQSLLNQLSSYSQQLNQYEQSLAQLGEPDVSQDYAKLGVIQNEIQTLNVRIGEIYQLLNVGIAHSQKLETLKDGFKEIKSYVFTNALNELNFRTNQYLNELFELEASIKFTNEDQKIESKIILDGKVRSLGLLSGGQNRRFNLAVDLALADIVSYRKTSKLDMLIFDEYFKDLSEISMEKSLELLKSRKCPVILIEHNSIFKNIVDNTFFVRLENGTSRESRQ